MINLKGDLVITAFEPYVSAGVGDTISFTYKGTRFTQEIWSTDNSSGRDFYAFDESGRELVGKAYHDVAWDSADQAELEAFLDEVLEIWIEQYEKHVVPALQTAVHDAVVIVWDGLQDNDPSHPDAPA